jgi:hypothetical protein
MSRGDDGDGRIDTAGVRTEAAARVSCGEPSEPPIRRRRRFVFGRTESACGYRLRLSKPVSVGQIPC